MIKFAKTKNTAKIPTRATEDAAGFDLFAPHQFTVAPGEILDIEIGIACIVPKGWEGHIRSRSGKWFDSRMKAFGGTIDADFRGEVKASVYVVDVPDAVPITIEAGKAFAQMVVSPYMGESEEITLDELIQNVTRRGESGFGHSG